MTAPQVVVFLVIGLIVFAVIFLRMSRSANVTATADRSTPKVRAFLERTGYVFADARQSPLDAQAQRWRQAYLTSTKGLGYKVHLVRSYQGLEVHWEHSKTWQYRQTIWAQTWFMPLPSPPRTLFHVSERTNINGAPTSVTSTWQPAFPRVIMTGDPQLDSRFVTYGIDDHSVRAVLANPTLRQALLACAYVDLRVMPNSVRFSDPMEKNAVAVLGGPQAAMQVVADPGTKFERTQSMHDHVASVLYGAASLAR